MQPRVQKVDIRRSTRPRGIDLALRRRSEPYAQVNCICIGYICSLDRDQARQYVIDNVSVTRDRLVLMKSLLLKHYHNNPSLMIDNAVRELGSEKPPELVLHPTVDPVPA